MAVNKADKETIPQSIVVPMLQKYLETNHHALKVNENGICNGLAAVYCKYAAKGQENLFFEMLRKIEALGHKAAGGTPQEAIDESQVNQFIAEVLFTFLPQKFNKTLCQDDAGRLVKIESDGAGVKTGIPLKQEYNLGLVATPDAWGQIFNRLKANGGVMTVATPTHAIAISVKDDAFHVYDPNHNKMEIFTDTLEPDTEPPKVKLSAGTKLARRLAGEIFPENQDTPASLLALTVNIFSHPDRPLTHQFPELGVILKNISKKDTVPNESLNQVVHFAGKPFDSLAMAAMQNDTKAIELLIAQGAKHPEVALQVAARDNRLKSIDVLLKEEYRHLYKEPKQVMVAACKLALEVGRFEAFSKLLEDKEVRAAFTEYLVQPLHQNDCMRKVASSGSPQCIEQYINFYENFPGSDTAQLIKSSNAIELAADSGNRSAVELLQRKAGYEVNTKNNDSLIDFPKNEVETNVFISLLKAFVQFMRDLLSIAKQKDIKSQLSEATGRTPTPEYDSLTIKVR